MILRRLTKNEIRSIDIRSRFYNFANYFTKKTISP